MIVICERIVNRMIDWQNCDWDGGVCEDRESEDCECEDYGWWEDSEDDDFVLHDCVQENYVCEYGV